MIYRNYFRFWNWLENFKSPVFARDLRPTLFLWASMGLSGSRIRTGPGTETEMDIVMNRMLVLSGNVQVALFSQKNSDFLLQNPLDIRFRQQQVKFQTFQLLICHDNQESMFGKIWSKICLCTNLPYFLK